MHALLVVLVGLCASASPLRSTALVDGAGVRFEGRIYAGAPGCLHETTTEGCFTSCMRPTLVRSRGVEVQLTGSLAACDEAESGEAVRCPFTDGARVVVEGRLRRAGTRWLLEESALCRR